MRKIILISLLFLTIVSFGQTSLPTSQLWTVAGTNTYSYSPTTPISSLTNGYTARLKFTNANTSTATLNLNGSAIDLTKSDGTALSSGDISAGSVWWVIYDSSANKWKLSGGSGGTTYNFVTPLIESGGNVYLNTGSANNILAMDNSGSNYEFKSINSPLNVGTGSIGIQNAAADGSTKGAASFTSSDFDASSGNISIDYTNGQASSGSNNGFLTSTDWTTFNNKQSAITFGTGVQTALGVNVGTAGAFVVNGGALGTPSSGVATNLTGTASGLTAGTVTTNANLTGAITSSGNATSLGSFTSANLRGALTDELGTGATLFDGATPTSFIGTNITGIPISTGISGLGSGIATWLGTPSWTNFSSAITGTAPFWSLDNGGTLTNNNVFTGPTLSGLTASTESIRLRYNLSQTKTFNAGTITTQREVVFDAPTYAFASASTITNASTVAITGSPTAGSNATITNPYALNVQSGATLLGGTLSVSGNTTVSGTFNASSTTATSNYARIAPTFTVNANNATALIFQGSLTARNSSGDNLYSVWINNTLNNNNTSQSLYGLVADVTYSGINTNSATIYNLVSRSALSATAGNSTYYGLLVNPTWNTSGTFSGGIGYGIDINPTRTSVTGLTEIALRATSGQVLLGGTTVTASTRVDQRGLGTTNSTINHRWADSGNTLLGTITDDGTLKINHIGGNTSAPSIAAGAGAGTGPTVVVTNATDISGIVDVTTGTTPTGTNATIATITFNKAFASAPNVQLTPNNANAAGLAAALTMVYVTSTTTTFVITSGTTALTASTQYKWFYSILQ